MWLVPHLRFPEFTGEWEKLKLDAFTERVMRKNKNNLSKLPLTISAQYGLVDQITFFNKVVASTDMSNYYLLKKGEFAYNKSYSSDYPWGAIKRLDNYEQGALSSLYICFAPQDNVESDFILQYFESPKWHKGVSEIAVEGARNHGLLNISVQDFFHTYHYIPKDKKEQTKIAKLLMLLDKRIATQNKIIERLQSLMSGIRHNVFTRLQNGNLYKLGEFLTEYSERNRGQELPSVAVGKYGIRKRTDIYSKELSKDYSNNKVIYKNTLTIGMGSSQIDIGILLGDEMYCVSPAYTTYRIHNINPTYLQEYLIHINSILSFKYMITSVRQGKSVNKSALLQHKIFVCNENEQNTIQYAFKIIKEKIAIEQNILKDLIGQKKYLLSKMFI